MKNLKKNIIKKKEDFFKSIDEKLKI